MQATNVGRHFIEQRYRAGVVAHRMNLDAVLSVDLSLDDEVAARLGDADQGATFLPFAVEQRVRRRVAVVDSAFQHYGLAGPTSAVGAGMWQPDAFA